MGSHPGAWSRYDTLQKCLRRLPIGKHPLPASSPRPYLPGIVRARSQRVSEEDCADSGPSLVRDWKLPEAPRRAGTDAPVATAVVIGCLLLQTSRWGHQTRHRPAWVVRPESPAQIRYPAPATTRLSRSSVISVGSGKVTDRGSFSSKRGPLFNSYSYVRVKVVRYCGVPAKISLRARCSW